MDGTRRHDEPGRLPLQLGAAFGEALSSCGQARDPAGQEVFYGEEGAEQGSKLTKTRVNAVSKRHFGFTSARTCR